MYGSQFHSQLVLTTIRPSTELLQQKSSLMSAPKSKQKNFLALIFFVLITALASNAVFAGPSTPRLKGGNGNANGR